MTVANEVRAYRAPRRAAQAAATREAIVTAAGRLFAAQGYAPTTMAAIAAEAGVTPKSVYAVADKPRLLLLAIVSSAPAGTGTSAPETVDGLLRAAADDTATRLLRHYPLCRTLEQAAAAEPGLREHWRAHQRAHRAEAKRLVRAVASAGELRGGITAGRATDAVWALVTWHSIALLVEERGWGRAKLATWLEDLLRRLLLP